MPGYHDHLECLFDHALSGLALHRLIVDDQGNPADYVFECINPAFERLTGLRGEDILGRRATEVIPGLTQTDLIARYAQVVRTGETLQLEHYAPGLHRHYNVAAFRTGPEHFAVSFEDITERKQAEDLLTRTAQQISSEVGAEFLRSLVLNLARLLDAEYALVGEYLSAGSERIRCHAIYNAGTVSEGFEYDLAGTPCNSALSGGCCVFPEGVQAQFPQDRLLTEMGAEAYVGSPLLDSSGGRLGIIAVLWKSPLRKLLQATSAVQLFASRAASELERKRSEEALLRHAKELEQARREQEEAARNLQRMLDVVADARAKAERANRFKTDFLATASHEIRTPLNAILGVTELLETSTLSVQQKEDVATVRAAARVLLHLINDLLDLSKIESGCLKVESIPMALGETIRKAVWMVTAQAEHKNILLRSDLAAGLPEYLIGDPSRLGQILLNLLGNAVKFTDSGFVTLRCRLASSNPPRIRFEVEDTGIGIPESAQPGIFQPFVQADASMTRRFGGTGLGLAICRRLIEAMGGEIGVQSTPGAGSLFWFEVPVKLAPAPQPVVANVAAASSLAGCRVLVVEDNPVNQKVAMRLLERLGCTPVLASDGVEAVRLFQPGRFDAILMDCRMPLMDGLEATRAIRAAEANRVRTPVIALTANAMEEERNACFASGMDDYLTKPVSLEVLRKALGEWFQPPAGNSESACYHSSDEPLRIA